MNCRRSVERGQVNLVLVIIGTVGTVPGTFAEKMQEQEIGGRPETIPVIELLTMERILETKLKRKRSYTAEDTNKFNEERNFFKNSWYILVRILEALEKKKTISIFDSLRYLHNQKGKTHFWKDGRITDLVGDMRTVTAISYLVGNPSRIVRSPKLSNVKLDHYLTTYSLTLYLEWLLGLFVG